MAPASPGIMTARVLLPFITVSLIWGSTWFVIRSQLAVVPGPWSVCYRFGTAAVGMFALALIMRQRLRLEPQGYLWAGLLGLMQFSLNFNFVYAAEHHITSGLVAVLFASLIIPNALIARLWLGIRVAPAFWIGSGIAASGIALLILREYRVAPVGGHEVLIGAGLTLTAVMCASVSNVIQANESMKRHPMVPLLAYAMLFGASLDALFAWVRFGPPVVEPTALYAGGVLYLAIIGTVLTFPLYFRLIRDIGPGKAAYTSVLIPIIAMLISTLFEGYHWSGLSMGGAALALIGLVIAMRARAS